MDNDIETFVRLKYEILTSDSDTWERCEASYPGSVKKKWAARCAADVEHLVKGYPKAEKCIKIAKLYRDGKATITELKKAWHDVPVATNHAAEAAAHAAYSTYHAAYSTYHHTAATYATYATYAADDATSAADDATGAVREEKWKLYIGWLIEELCEYEGTSTKNNNE